MDDNRIEALERRIAALEDRAAILHLMAAYGPAVDTLDASATAALWDDAGSYDWGDGPLHGAEAVGGLIHYDQHVSYVTAGSAHVLGLPLLALSGDRATAVNYSRVYLREGDGWRIERCSANHWSFRRTDRGWRVEARQNRLLDGAEAARALLAQGLAEAGVVQ